MYVPPVISIKLPEALSAPVPLVLVMHLRLSAMKLIVLVVALANAWVGLASDVELRAGLQDFCASSTPFPMDQVCNAVGLTTNATGCAGG